jgi:putative transposase
METEDDHCHILFEAKPQTEIVKLVNSFKTVTSRLLRKEFTEHLKPFYWKPKFWSNSYCIVSTGGAPLDIVAQYVRNQDKPKH